MLRRALLTVVVLAAAACSSGGVSQTSSAPRASDPTGEVTIDVTAGSPTTVAGSEPATDTSDVTFEPTPIAWEPYNDAVDVATIAVPVDYTEPDGETFELFVAKYKALDQENKVGSLLVNPGGPGFGGSDFAIFAAQVPYDRALLERFDIIGWDPRGTGESDPPIDCIDDYDEYYTKLDYTPADDAARQAIVDTAQRFADECAEKNPLLEYVGTNNSARDMDTIRRALGEETISYFGFSYGSELGAVWATMFPDTVRAAVLDGAADPDADPLESSLQQMRGFEASLSTFLAECSADPTCEYHNGGNAEAAFDALMARLDATPIVGDDGRPPINRDVALGGVVEAMYRDEYWPSLAKSLAAAELGDGSGLLALYDEYFQRSPDGTWGNPLEAFQVISCADSPERTGVDEADADAGQRIEAAPRLVPEGSVGDYFCTFFPPSIDPRIPVTGAGAGAIVVVGTTGDPSTPLESSRAMADALEDGRFVIVEANQHTGYGVNDCIVDLVNAYLIDLEAPADETECAA